MLDENPLVLLNLSIGGRKAREKERGREGEGEERKRENLNLTEFYLAFSLFTTLQIYIALLDMYSFDTRFLNVRILSHCFILSGKALYFYFFIKHILLRISRSCIAISPACRVCLSLSFLTFLIYFLFVPIASFLRS